ncbi:MAG: adenosylmethionine decarboxylase [Bacteroidota bacterium]
MNYLGTHKILELYDCPSELLKDPDKIEAIMQQAAIACEAHIVQSNFHHFSPLGVSGVVIIQESHLTIHTWPEYGYAAIDIFTCGPIKLSKGIEYLTKKLAAKHSEVKTLHRGALKTIKTS